MKRTKLIITGVLVLVVSVILLSLLLSSEGLTVTRYRLPCEGLDRPVRIVQLSDLHNSEFGEGNARLIRRVRQQKPDLIFLTGDMLNYDEKSTDIDENLIRCLSEIAPVYASYGNHEITHEKIFTEDLHGMYSEAGAVLLESDWADVEVNGQALRIGGIYGYCVPADAPYTWEAESGVAVFMNEYQETDRIKILLCHIPHAWMKKNTLDYWDVDFVFAGHFHGGQIRIPLIGGLYAPDRGWFPGKCAGLYVGGDSANCLVLSRGLGGGTGRFPRFNNIPEIVVVELAAG